MMVTMSNVWERTTAFMGAHARSLTVLTLALLFAPAAIDAVLQAWSTAPGNTPGLGARTVIALVSLVLGLITFFGQVAVVALVLDGGSVRNAVHRALQRFPAAVGVTLILVVAFVFVTIPLLLPLAADGVDMSMAEGGSAPTLSGASIAAVLIYVLVGLPVALWLSARLSVLTALVVGERRGWRAIPAAFAATRGLAARIVGALLLILIVGVVAILAIQLVVGSILRLALGGDAGFDVAAAVTGVIVALAVAALTALLSVFLAQLYLALRARLEGPATA